MVPKEFIRILHTVEPLKCNTRHSWTSTGRHESVAEHSWRLALMAFFARDEFPAADMDKVIRMCLVHDIGEAFTGDIPTFLKTEADEQTEGNVVDRFLDTFPEPYNSELRALLAEMSAIETTEAKLYKALDKMEAVIQHNEADISTWLPLEYYLQLTYGEKEVQFSEYTRALKQAANDITQQKIADKTADS